LRSQAVTRLEAPLSGTESRRRKPFFRASSLNPTLRQDFLDHIRSLFGTSELLIETLVLVSEALVVNAELVK
jgi:hypothetical protein